MKVRASPVAWPRGSENTPAPPTALSAWHRATWPQEPNGPPRPRRLRGPTPFGNARYLSRGARMPRSASGSAVTCSDLLTSPPTPLAKSASASGAAPAIRWASAWSAAESTTKPGRRRTPSCCAGTSASRGWRPRSGHLASETKAVRPELPEGKSAPARGWTRRPSSPRAVARPLMAARHSFHRHPPSMRPGHPGQHDGQRRRVAHAPVPRGGVRDGVHDLRILLPGPGVLRGCLPRAGATAATAGRQRAASAQRGRPARSS